jgi:hypothetical protein
MEDVALILDSPLYENQTKQLLPQQIVSPLRQPSATILRFGSIAEEELNAEVVILVASQESKNIRALTSKEWLALAQRMNDRKFLIVAIGAEPSFLFSNNLPLEFPLPRKFPTYQEFLRNVNSLIDEAKSPRSAVKKDMLSNLRITFDPNLEPEQIAGVLTSLANYFRACGGVGLAADFEIKEAYLRDYIDA